MTVFLSEKDAADMGLESQTSDDPIKALFLDHWSLYAHEDLPKPVPEYRFARDLLGRQWRTDIAWPTVCVALEFEGGIWSKAKGKSCPTCGLPPKGSHGRGWGILRDMEKGLAYTGLGWRVMRVPSHAYKNDVQVQNLVLSQAIALVRRQWLGRQAWEMMRAVICELSEKWLGEEAPPENLKAALDDFGLAYSVLSNVTDEVDLWAKQPWAYKPKRGR